MSGNYDQPRATMLGLALALVLACVPSVAPAQSPEVRQKNADAVARLKAEIEGGDTDAMYALAHAYQEGGFYGWGLPQDYAEARRLYQMAAERGHEAAANNLGRLYGRGLGVEVNYPEAMRWYRVAAGRGSLRAMYNIAGMYKRGDLGSMDLVSAVAWYKLANDHVSQNPATWSIGTRALMEMFFEPCVLAGQMTSADRENSEALYRELSADMRSPVPEAERLGNMPGVREVCEKGVSR